ncbi:hypothetical protein Ddye_020690 [Dipteronia dyeriana]|uniref:Uncharacterized protein n=1 Tax=Dipteronia dyeriana TaxID=168575 RepID=A0AAD9WX97_9ROSI|nr:hypothetical protein Ddye_020690 [Dipteronia dyeriana]
MKGKGLPVTVRIALLNTIYKEYKHAVIGTCLSTLHTSSISLTYYPNFNISLRDQNLHNCLKVKLQVARAPMMPNSYMVTLYHQIAYKLQDHALDLPIPGHTGDTLFIKAEREDEVPTIIQIPKQLMLLHQTPNSPSYQMALSRPLMNQSQPMLLMLLPVHHLSFRFS